MPILSNLARAVSEARGAIRRAREEARQRVDRAVALIQAQRTPAGGGQERSTIPARRPAARRPPGE